MLTQSPKGTNWKSIEWSKNLSKLLFGGVEMSSGAPGDMTSREAYPDPDFKWIHLPANNVRSFSTFIF
jgi:hypothetical protein